MRAPRSPPLRPRRRGRRARRAGGRAGPRRCAGRSSRAGRGTLPSAFRRAAWRCPAWGSGGRRRARWGCPDRRRSRPPRPIAAEQRAELVGQRHAGGDQVVAPAHQGAQRADLVALRPQRREAVPVGAQQVGEQEAVGAVALGAARVVARSGRLDGVGVDLSDTARVTLEVDGDGVARLTFDHPRRLNAITAAMWRALPGLLDRVEEDRAVRVLLLQGAGERAFCTGNDTSEFDAIRADAAQSAALQRPAARGGASAWRALSKPAVAAIQGHCLGAGLELALQCDLRFASADARHGRARRAARPALPAGGHRQAGGRGRPRHGAAPGADRGQRDGRGAGAPRPRHRLVPDQAAMRAAAAEAAAGIAAAAPLSLPPPRPPSSSCRAATRRRTCTARSASPTPATTAPTTPRAGPRAAKAGRRASRGNDADAPPRAAARRRRHAPRRPRARRSRAGRSACWWASPPAAPRTSRCASRRTPWRGAAGPPWSPRPAAARSGFLAAQAVSRAAPDGHTLGTASWA